MQLQWTDTLVTVKWPYLAVVCVLGIVLVLGAGCHLLLSLSDSRKPRSSSGFFTWGLAFVWYAFMCVGGLVFHCFQRHPAFYFLDLVSTGSSSMSILIGFAVFANLVDDRPLKWRLACLVIHICVAAVGLFAPPLIREQVYIVPTVVALLAGQLFLAKSLITSFRQGKLVHDLTTDSPQCWLLLASVSILLGAAALVGDRFLCFVFGSNGGFIVWFFLGCDLFILCAYRVVLLMDKEQTRLFKSK